MRNRTKARSVVTPGVMRRESPGEGAWDLEDGGLRSVPEGGAAAGGEQASERGRAQSGVSWRTVLGPGASLLVAGAGGRWGGWSLAWGESFVGCGGHGETPRFWEAQKPSSEQACLRGLESTPGGEGLCGEQQAQCPEWVEGAPAKPLRVLGSWVLLGPARSWGSRPP